MDIFGKLFGSTNQGTQGVAPNQQNNTMQPGQNPQQQGGQQGMQQGTQQNAGSNGNAGAGNPNNNQWVPNSSNVPPNNGQQAADNGGKSPLDQFADLWQPATNPQPPQSVVGNVDPAKVMEAAKKMDFSRILPQDLLAKISAGGQDAQTALAQAMNMVSQATYAQSSMATAQIVKQAIEEARNQFVQQIPGLIKQHSLTDSMRTENPAFSNPAVAPIVSAIEKQIATKFPNASSTELRDMTKQYFQQISEIMGAPQQQQQQQQTAGNGRRQETDWSSFLNL